MINYKQEVETIFFEEKNIFHLLVVYFRHKTLENPKGKRCDVDEGTLVPLSGTQRPKEILDKAKNEEDFSFFLFLSLSSLFCFEYNLLKMILKKARQGTSERERWEFNGPLFTSHPGHSPLNIFLNVPFLFLHVESKKCVKTDGRQQEKPRRRRSKTKIGMNSESDSTQSSARFTDSTAPKRHS